MARRKALLIAFGIILVARMLSPGAGPQVPVPLPETPRPTPSASLTLAPGPKAETNVSRSEVAVETVAPEEPAPAAETTELSFQSGIEDQLGELTGAYGVAIQNLETGQTVLINADQVFQAGSTYKLLVMYRVFEYIEDGWLEFDDVFSITAYESEQDQPFVSVWPGEMVTVEEALELMITLSSNAAAHALARQVGGWTSVVLAAEELGMSQTVLVDGHFRTTPSDMLSFLDSLAGGTLVSEEASDMMIELLGRQRLNGRLPALLPAEALVAHKTGELEGVRNDVGLVYGPDASYAICVLSDGVNFDEADSFIAELALDAYEYFARQRPAA